MRAKNPIAYADSELLSEGSLEEEYILSHCRYMSPSTLWRLLAPTIVSMVALVALFIWAGTTLADAAFFPALLQERGVTSLADVTNGVGDLPFALLAVLLIGGVVIAAQALYSTSLRRFILGCVSPSLIVLCAPAVISHASAEFWWSGWTMAAILLGGGVLLGVIAFAVGQAQRLRVEGYWAAGLNFAAAMAPRLLGLVLFAWWAMWGYRFLSDALEQSGWIYIASFSAIVFAPILFSKILPRASLHREYRLRLASCFSVGRNGNQSAEVADVALTTLSPPTDPARSFPRLLVCATANFNFLLPALARKTFAPFVLSYDVCGIPGRPGASFQTSKLELLRESTGAGQEPLVTLFTSVATTGAAVSPSMGRQSIPSLQPLIAALNIRLGRWFPNPLKGSSVRAVSDRTHPGWFTKGNALGRGYDDLVPEMFGFEGRRVYVSDGGHYDNLGLLTLMRARCAEIWCIDASPEPSGSASELRRILETAKEELKIRSEIDLDRFAAGPSRLYGATHTAGVLTYDDGSTCRLTVIKLGLTEDSPEALRDRRVTDRGLPLMAGFPHHTTLNQVYDRDRMNAYRLLGRDSTRRCLVTAWAEEGEVTPPV